MWYDRPKARMIFMFGAMLIFLGIGMYMMDLRTAGGISAAVGVAVMVVGLTILRLHLRLWLKNNR
ncbi:MAG: hypothetical protein FWG58_03675 [Methanomassiliicoccaceae archaeon]|nr:hypothetical protein [Methanomassiliicoccaceae archaeon]